MALALTNEWPGFQITRQGQLRSPSAAGTAVSDVVSCCGLLLSSSVCPHQQHNRCCGRNVASQHSSELLEIKFSVESLMGFKSPLTLYCLTRMYSNGLLFIHVHDLCVYFCSIEFWWKMFILLKVQIHLMRALQFLVTFSSTRHEKAIKIPESK